MLSFLSKNILKILFIFFFMWIIFFDENALLRQIKIGNEINSQNKEISRLKKLIKNDSILIENLNSDTLSHELEKILREEYLYSKENEIIYKIEKQ
ncbi:MAG: septum formation initiator [Flavobacteriales bacterium]|nr:septum formation initiator [Flavobacteriales bacterium]